jgi:zinc/manganese transport system substrate-binding protein
MIAKTALGFLVAPLAAAPLFMNPAMAKTLDVVASFSVLGDVAREIGGSHISVKNLIGPNGDPHVFDPSPQDAKIVRDADLVFVSGYGLEGWMDRLITASGYKGKPVVASKGVTTIAGDPDEHESVDPHVWNNPLNVVVWTRNIEAALSSADPEDAAEFKANAEHYVSELRAEDTHARETINAIPKPDRKILTSHDAFGYFAKAYNVKFLSPLGISTDAEASAGDVARVINQIKKEKVKTYFLEKSNDPRLVEQIAHATGVEPGGILYVEALSEPDGPAPTYLKMFRYNVDKLVDAMRR